MADPKARIRSAPHAESARQYPTIASGSHREKFFAIRRSNGADADRESWRGARQGRENREGLPEPLPSPGKPGEVSSQHLCTPNRRGRFVRKAALRMDKSMGCAGSKAPSDVASRRGNAAEPHVSEMNAAAVACHPVISFLAHIHVPPFTVHGREFVQKTPHRILRFVPPDSPPGKQLQTTELFIMHGQLTCDADTIHCARTYSIDRCGGSMRARIDCL